VNLPRHILRRFGGWLAALAMSAQILLPVAHHPATMALGQAAFGVTGSMCLAPGGEPVGSEPAGPGDKSPIHKLPVCPICQAAHAIGGYISPTVSTVSVPRAFETAAYRPAPLSSPALWPRISGQPRAPPVKI
jgi:hypothetical protein